MIKAIVMVMAARLAELHLTMIDALKSQVAFCSEKNGALRELRSMKFEEED